MAQEKYPNPSAPPRKLSLSVKLMIYFVGGKNLKTWFIFAICGFFFFTLTRSHGKSYLLPFLPQTTAQAIVIGSEIDEKTELISYQFYDHQEQLHEAFSYLPRKDATTTAAITTPTVLYSALFPSISKLEGAQNPGAVQFALITVIFLFFVSIFFVIILLIKRTKELMLLKKGKLTYGGLTSRKTVHTDDQKLHAYELEFAYLVPETGDRVHHLSTQTLEIDEITDDPREAIFYMSNAPQKATLFDAIPGDLSINFAGKIYATRSIADPIGVVFITFALPVVGYIINIAYPILDIFEILIDALLDA